MLAEIRHTRSKRTIVCLPRNRFRADLLLCRTSGSYPWYAVACSGDVGQTITDVEQGPAMAQWLPSGVTQVGEHTTDGMVRFFRSKRELLAAVDRLVG